MPRTSLFVIELSAAERSILEVIKRRHTSPYRDVVRARIVLMAAEDLENKEIEQRPPIPFQIASRWRKRFFEERLPGLDDGDGSGRDPVPPPGAGRRRQGDRM